MTAEVKDTMNCEYCGTEMENGINCELCEARPVVCPACGEEVQKGDACSNCGHELGHDPEA